MGTLKGRDRMPSRTSYQGYRPSSSGRKPDGKLHGTINLKAVGASVLLMAAFVATVGILRVEDMHLKTLPPKAEKSPFAATRSHPSVQQQAQQQVQLNNAHPAPQPAPAPQHGMEHHATAAPVPDELPAHPSHQNNQQYADAPAAAHSASAEEYSLHHLEAAAATDAAAPAQPADAATLSSTAALPLRATETTTATNPEPSMHPSSTLPKNRLLLASHSRLLWYFPDTDEYLIIHEGEGVHYGMFPGAGNPPTTVWTAIRPHNWRPTTTKEYLVEFDMVKGEELRRVAIPSRFTHDVVRSGDSVYVCDTGSGRILQLSFPDMKPVRSMDLFTLRDHPNTLAPLADDNFLVVLHNLGESDIVRVNVSAVPTIQNPEAWLAAETQSLAAIDPTATERQPAATTQNTAAIVGRVQRVGQKAHGLVPWQGAYILLDSDSGALMALDLTGAAAGQGFKLHRLWKAPEEGVFLKGLTVVDDIAYFGISPWAPRSARDDPKSNNELAAFDLISGNLLWRRQVPTAGLLNIIGAPHLTVGSTYLPSYTGRPETDAVKKHHSSPEVAVALKSLTKLGYPPKIGGYWSSGLPYLDATLKATRTPWEAGLQLPLLMMNISKLQTAIAALPKEAWTYEYQARYSAVMAGREGNQNAFKPGVEGIVLLFSANDGHGPVYKFPAYDYFAPVLEPLLEEILGKRDMQHIIRLQLALMKPGVSDIKIHVDSGGYAIHGHRLHIPVFTHPEVSFDVCPHRYVPDPTHVPADGEPQRILDIQECFKIPTVEGFAFELNNRAAHKVSNLSPVERVHVVFDLCEEPHPRVDVPAGTVCDYDMEKGLLCQYPEGQQPVVMAPAAYIDPEAAAAESTEIPEEQMQQIQQALDADTGSGYIPADDELAAVVAAGAPAGEDLLDTVHAPVPHLGVNNAVKLGVNYDLLSRPATGEDGSSSGSSRGVGELLGNVRNGFTSTWVTEAMRAQGSSGIAAV